MDKKSEIYFIYYCAGGYENDTEFKYLGFTYTLDSAKNSITHLLKYCKIHEIAHPDMNVNNNYTLFGYRHQCYPVLSFHGSGAGFIIEPWFTTKKIESHNITVEESKIEKENLKNVKSVVNT